MALDFSLDLATPASVGDVAAAVHRELVAAGDLDAATPPVALVEGDVALPGGLLVRVVARAPLPFAGPLEELGVHPAAAVTYRLDGYAEVTPQQDRVVRSVVAVLAAVPGDAALRYVSDDLWLLRRGDELHLSDDDDRWPPGRRALVTLPHDRRPLALPE